MEASFISVDNRTSNRKPLALIALAVVGTFAACFLLLNQSASSTLLDNRTAAYDSYVHWKVRNNKTYGGAEDQQRFNHYLNNYKIVEEHSQTNSTYTLGMTPFAAMSREEFAATHLGLLPRTTPKSRVSVSQNVGDALLSVDWRGKAVTAIKNQGQCGSCWAFSTTGALEGLEGVKTGKLISLSEQELVDCSDAEGNYGCNGGLMDNAFKYVEKYGLESEADYPYKGADGNCNRKDGKAAFKITGFKDVPVNDAAELKAALANQPVSVAIEADTSAFQLYTGGVISGGACGTQLDHGVLAVGYSTTQDGKDVNGNYYIVKNSWGPSWGDHGYVKIAIEEDQAKGEGVCGIQKDASYPTL